MRTALLFLLGWAMAATPALAQSNFANVRITTEKLSERVYVVFGSGGNVAFYVGDTRTLMIDDQFAPLAPRLEATARDLKDQPVSFLINTHWHGDHSGGNEHFGKTGTLILAHDNVHKRMSTEQVSGFNGNAIPPSPDDALPFLTYSHTATVREDEETIYLLHVEHAHTDGDTLIYFKNANVLHMGDVFFFGRFPYIDLASGGSLPGVVSAMDVTLDLVEEDTKIIPGHGKIATYAQLRETRNMLADIADKAAAAIKAGDDLEAFVASDPAAAYGDVVATSGVDWTKRFLGFAYNSVSN